MPFCPTGIFVCDYAIDVSFDCYKNKNLIQESFVQHSLKNLFILFLLLPHPPPFFLITQTAKEPGPG